MNYGIQINSNNIIVGSIATSVSAVQAITLSNP